MFFHCKRDMHKSALIFGLLSSSLIMLAIMPFLNQNNSFLSNLVMAQEYDKYGDSSYSTHQTDDKKYECQTGPFEGFFVSSVEFCKNVKFGDNNDVGDGNGVGVQFCILESLEGCFQQHVEESKLEIIKLAFDAGVEFSTEVYGPDLIPQQVTFSSFEDICLILNTIPTTYNEFNSSIYRILAVLPSLEPFTHEFGELWNCIVDAAVF
jgi:hypothetical protein